MKTKRTMAVVMGTLLVLASCNNIGNSSGDISDTSSDDSSSTDTSSGTDTSDGTSSTIDPIGLAAPVLSLNDNNNGLVWNAVEHALGYQLKVNDGEYASATEYAFSETVGNYSVSVIALGNGVEYSNSEPAIWDYETCAVALNDLVKDGSTISWSGDYLAAEMAFSKTGDFASAEYTQTTTSSYDIVETGKLSIRVSGGYDTEDDIYYIGQSVSKIANIVVDATANLTILDGNEDDLVDIFTIKYYNYSSGGEDISSTAKVTAINNEVEGNGKALDFYYQVGGTYYKYMMDIEKPIDGYKGISLYAKGDGFSSMFIQFSGDLYVSYNLGVLSTNWNYFYIPFSDSGWKVNGTSVSLSEAVASAGAMYGIYSINEVVNILSKLTLGFKTVAATYQFTHVFADQIRLIADDGGTNRNIFNLRDKYTGQNSFGQAFKVAKTGETTAQISSLNLASNISADVTVSKDGNNLVLATLDEGASLTYTLSAGESGDILTFVSATGTYAPYFQNVNLYRNYAVEDFESYAETGIGYDQNHAASERSGLRASYLSDYYAGDGSSPISGTGWKLMGSTDYLNLKADSAASHSGDNSGEFKVGNAMRHTSYGLYDGTAAPWPKADTFSFWVKSPADINLSLYVRLFSVSKVNSSNYSITPTLLTINANTDWTQYTVAMDATKTYFGMSLTFERSSNYQTYRPLVDDIELYTTTSPWATYQA